jgi:hypothetical protein
VPKDKSSVEAFARSVVEDGKVQALILRQAQDGSLPAPMFQMLFHYAYGKPLEQTRPDEQAFTHALLAVVLKHVGSPEARQEVRAVIEAYTGPAPLRAVA